MDKQAVQIEVVSAEGVRATYEMDQEATVGRGKDNAICIKDPGASRYHARVYESEHRYWVEDLKSRNGTSVSGKAITRHALTNGDVIEIGQHRLHFSCPEPSPEDHVQITDSEQAPQSVIQKTLDAQDYNPEQALSQTATERKADRLSRHLKTLHSIGSEIGAILDLEDLLNKLLDHVFETFAKAEKAFILLRDDAQSSRLVPRVSKTRSEGDSTKLTVSSTLIRRVMRDKQSILSADAQSDFDEIASIKKHGIQSMACVPLICRGKPLGVLHVHTTGRRGAFDEDDLHLLTSIGSQAAICVKNAQLYAQVKKETSLRRDFQRYVSPGVAEQIVQEKISVELGAQHCTGTVFFSDIVGFTALSEAHAPGEVVALLNQYFRLVVDVIFRHEGTVNKFGGDAILAVWGAPLQTDEGEFKAMGAGVGMQNAIFRLNLQLASRRRPTLGMGIGINTGRFMAGNIGSEDRMEYTIIGDAVNLASRIETKATRGQVLASETTYQAAADRVIAVELPATAVKGKSEPVVIYSIRGVAAVAGQPDAQLAIPVECSTSSGQEGDALLTHAKRRPERGFVLEMISPHPLPQGQAVHLAPQVEELPNLPPLECRVAEGVLGLVTGTADFSLVSLELEEADERVLALFEPGHPLRSPLESIDGLRGK